MSASVKALRNFGTKNRMDALRVQLMAGEMSVRIGQRIREARHDLGINQRELAAKINEIAEADGGAATPIDNQRVSDWERGVNKPSERYMTLLASALDRKMSWFWEIPGQETPDPFAKVSTVDQVGDGFEEFRQYVRDIRRDIAEANETAQRERESIRKLLAAQQHILEDMRRVAAGLPDQDALKMWNEGSQDVLAAAEALRAARSASEGAQDETPRRRATDG